MSEDPFHCFVLINHGDHAHRVLAAGADERVAVPDLLDEVAPPFGGEPGGWRRSAGWPQWSRGRGLVMPAMPLASHLVWNTSRSSGPFERPFPGYGR